MPRILVVDDDPGAVQVVGRMVSGLADVRVATSGPAALKLAQSYPFDLVLLDAEMPGMTGWQVCAALKAVPETAGVPVIFVTGHDAEDAEIKGLALGAADFIAKPVSQPLLLARVRNQLRIKQLTDELRRLAAIDALTGVANRRTFDQLLASEWRRATRTRQPISLLIVDVDHFKVYNDHYGHPAGDTCLRSVGEALERACLRPADLVARYGGEEFAIVLPETPAGSAEGFAQRVSDAVTTSNIPHAASPTASHVTVSVGIATHAWPSGVDAITELDLIRGADQALYAAKRAGRGQAWALDVAHLATAEPRFVQRRDATCRIRVV